MNLCTMATRYPSEQPKEPPRYEYQPLDVKACEIRVAELLLGDFHDALQVRIHHTVLSTESGSESAIFSCVRPGLQETAPEDWIVRETLQGRIVFEKQRAYGPEEPYETAWEHPVTGEIPPVCSACYPSIASAVPQYEALSHVWGSGRTDAAVWLQNAALSHNTPNILGDTLWSKLSITEDLATAMRYLRYASSSRKLWIDINQQDLAERGHQVGYMGIVFRRAQRVVVWLGPEHSDSEVAFAALKNFGDQVELVEDGRWRINTPGCAHPTWSRTPVPLPLGQHEMSAILRIVARPWFFRLWVWQEATLGSDRSIMKCGRDEMLLHAFGKATWCIAVKASTISLERQSLLFNAGDATIPRLVEPFLATLMNLSGKACLNPRDKVYGALGLISQHSISSIMIDYSKDAKEVYKNAFLALSVASGRIDFLMACDLSTRAITGPTWVPDLSVAMPRPSKWHSSSFHASDASVSMIHLSRGSSTESLQVLAVPIGSINWVGRKAASDSAGLYPALKEWFQYMSAKGSGTDTGAPVVETLARNIHWGFLQERFPVDYTLPTLASATRQLEDVISGARRLDSSDMRQARSRLLFTTAASRCGLTSAMARPGDTVHVLLGCLMPMILRPVNGGGYQVVGPTYMDGYMDAEALLGPLPAHWKIDVGAHPGWYGTFRYTNTATWKTTQEDPRLDPLPSDWECLKATRTPLDAMQLVRFRNRSTGEVINGDPRLLPDALRSRGVQIETLNLV